MYIFSSEFDCVFFAFNLKFLQMIESVSTDVDDIVCSVRDKYQLWFCCIPIYIPGVIKIQTMALLFPSGKSCQKQ